MDYCKKCQRPLTLSYIGLWCEHCGRRPKPGIKAEDPFERPLLDHGLGQLGEACPYCAHYGNVPKCGTCRGTGIVCVAPNVRLEQHMAGMPVSDVTADKALVDGTEIDFAGREQMQPGKPT